jgi:hypothetical protein
MLIDEVRQELTREPFIPLRFHLRNGKKLDVPFREVAHLLGYGVLIFIGLKPGTHQARSYDRFGFDDIVRIEQLRRGKGGQRQRKAS